MGYQSYEDEDQCPEGPDGADPPHHVCDDREGVAAPRGVADVQSGECGQGLPGDGPAGEQGEIGDGVQEFVNGLAPEYGEVEKV